MKCVGVTAVYQSNPAGTIAATNGRHTTAPNATAPNATAPPLPEPDVRAVSCAINAKIAGTLKIASARPGKTQ
jgi:hypothetical protein